ncbi:hypothetical protein T492DRAFT_494770 [Pavlovales sp. CCMP2436]|nr:hypothetical protein T492DRAFT_494770 [Pavlovales sp. CCMP2436]
MLTGEAGLRHPLVFYARHAAKRVQERATQLYAQELAPHLPRGLPDGPRAHATHAPAPPPDAPSAPAPPPVPAAATAALAAERKPSQRPPASTSGEARLESVPLDRWPAHSLDGELGEVLNAVEASAVMAAPLPMRGPRRSFGDVSLLRHASDGAGAAASAAEEAEEQLSQAAFDARLRALDQTLATLRTEDSASDI